MTRTSLHAKNTKKTSQEVKEILHKKGYSALFNFRDYLYFKQKAKNAFNKAEAIAEMFISENSGAENDFNQYVF